MKPTQVYLIFAFFIAILLVTNWITYNKIPLSDDKAKLKKLDLDLDSLKKVNAILNASLFTEHKKVERLNKQDSLYGVEIKALKQQDNTLGKQEEGIHNSYILLTQHQLLDSLHKFYAQDH